jgi:hypothetical protein
MESQEIVFTGPYERNLPITTEEQLRKSACESREETGSVRSAQIWKIEEEKEEEERGFVTERMWYETKGCVCRMRCESEVRITHFQSACSVMTAPRSRLMRLPGI